MVFASAGVSRTPDQLSDQVFIPARDGSLQVEMQAAPRRYGLVSVVLKPQLKDLLAEVAAGKPVIVLQNLALDWYPKWHYAVAIGYDLDKDVMILRSGTERRQEIAMRTFERTWRRGGYWALLVLPPDRLPQTVDADGYVDAVVQLESAGAAGAARQAYESALQRWPENLKAQIGLGNTSYAAGDLPAAVSAFRQATASHPDSAIAFNNLAQALADSGQHAEALIQARRAVALGGPTATASLRTLQAIEKIGGNGR